MICKLCSNTKLKSLTSADNREFYLCGKCFLISASPESYLTENEEKKRYLTHNNGNDQPGYVRFLNKAINPALHYLNKDLLGLDYGCGYAPTLSSLLKNKGLNCEDYDPLFVENELKKKYDFIFSTEVFEHFINPKYELNKIYDLLNPNGILIIMTERWDDLNKFNKWYYTRDSSHIAFYNSKTFEYISQNFGFEIIFEDSKRVIIMRKITK